ncbi:MAG: type II toxin-antitoxin system VapC family toxin [Bacteroidota bacterium]
MILGVFLDANIILDYTLQRQSYQECYVIIEKALAGDLVAYTTPSVIQISGYWLSKTYGKETAKEILLALTDIVTIIESDHQGTIKALQSDIMDVEDAIQYQTALKYKLSYFISLDKELAKKAKNELPIKDPQEFLQIIS